MSQRLRQCLRLAQVRSIEHSLAALAAEQSLRKVVALETSAAQLARLRDGFGAQCGTSSGAALASIGEIAMRLDLARQSIGRSIDGARAQAEAAGEARLAARQRQESSEKLSDKAAREAAKAAEKKALAQPRARKSAGDAA